MCKLLFKKIKNNKYIFVLLIINVILVYSEQIVHATGYGAYNIRYLLPLWLPLGLSFAFGLGGNPKWRGSGVIIGVLINWCFVITHILYHLNVKISPILDYENVIQYLNHIVVDVHDLPSIALLVPIVFLPTGIFLMSRSLWIITKENE